VGASPSGYVWAVNLNNGNVNYINPNNNGFVRGGRLVPASECQDAVTFGQLLAAREAARANKKPSVNMYEFETRWLPNLLALLEQINAGTWSPKATTCFIATKPKAREIHAPDFADRIVHHLVVPYIEAIYEPIFIHDSYSNREGKGTHEAVERLSQFFRQVGSGQGGGYYLQLDISNCFYSIDRRILWPMVKARMQACSVPPVIQRLVHEVLRRNPVDQGVIYRASAAERALIPKHKRLDLVGPGLGMPIGNYSSQSLANVYLNELDQFVKHVLQVKRYERYVDDFVLVHQDREQLLAWKAEIEAFLAERLKLRLKDEWHLRPLKDGCDFLGYVVRPTHTVVRRRVIQHAREKLWGFQQAHVAGGLLRVTPEAYAAGRAVWASYEGHFAHARNHQLKAEFHNRYPWLRAFQRRRRFDHRLAGQPVAISF
jgi:RNA-directed DNA polymerase